MCVCVCTFHTRSISQHIVQIHERNGQDAEMQTFLRTYDCLKNLVRWVEQTIFHTWVGALQLQHTVEMYAGNVCVKHKNALLPA